MDEQALFRPEVWLNACPADGDSMFRVYDAEGVIFECITCGLRLDEQRQQAA
jgi:hypothetical protein